MAYDRFVERDRRLIVLRITATGDGTANDSLLRSVLRGAWGIATSPEEIRATIDWLVLHKLLKSEVRPGGTVVVRLTATGSEIARGDAVHPEITPRHEMAD